MFLFSFALSTVSKEKIKAVRVCEQATIQWFKVFCGSSEGSKRKKSMLVCKFAHPAAYAGLPAAKENSMSLERRSALRVKQRR